MRQASASIAQRHGKGEPAQPFRGSSFEIRGRGASIGSFSGVARVITGTDDVAKVHTGDVLVCPSLSPAMSQLLPKIGAVVSDSGGVLSNFATIARERGVPVVVAARHATATIRDGQRVAVDGASGAVCILNERGV